MPNKSTSLQGVVQEKNVKMGAGRMFLGDSTAVFDGTAKFDTNNPGSHWEDLGAMAQNVTVNMTTTMLMYKQGIPSNIKKTFVQGRDGTLQAEFDEFKARVIQTALGLIKPINRMAGNNYVIQASPAPTAQVFTLDQVSGLNVGDEVVHATSNGLLTNATDAALVDSIVGNVVTLKSPLPNGAPTALDALDVRISAKLVFGSSDVRTYPLLFVVDFVTDKKQFVSFFPKVSSKGAFNPTGLHSLGSDHVKTTIQWDIYGVYDADVDDIALAQFFPFEGEE